MSNSRMRIKELCDARHWSMEYVDKSVTGPPHLPRFTCALRLVDFTGNEVLRSAQASGFTKKEAQESAAALALASVP